MKFEISPFLEFYLSSDKKYDINSINAVIDDYKKENSSDKIINLVMYKFLYILFLSDKMEKRSDSLEKWKDRIELNNIEMFLNLINNSTTVDISKEIELYNEISFTYIY